MTYGLSFENKSMQYSILTWASSFDCQWVSPTSRVIQHFKFKEMFLQNMLRDLQQNNISECALFALLFAILASFHEVRNDGVREFVGNNEELRFHQTAFLRILKTLNTDKTQIVNRPLQYLYNYALSLIRLWASESADASLNYDMHLAAEGTPMPVSVKDRRATFALPAQFWLRERSPAPWQALEWSLSDDVRALHSCFQLMLVSNPEYQVEKIYNVKVATSIAYLRRKVADMRSLPAVSRIFQYVLFTYEYSTNSRSQHLKNQ
jgi:hypothetical protein